MPSSEVGWEPIQRPYGSSPKPRPASHPPEFADFARCLLGIREGTIQTQEFGPSLEDLFDLAIHGHKSNPTLMLPQAIRLSMGGEHDEECIFLNAGFEAEGGDCFRRRRCLDRAMPMLVETRPSQTGRPGDVVEVASSARTWWLDRPPTSSSTRRRNSLVGHCGNVGPGPRTNLAVAQSESSWSVLYHQGRDGHQERRRLGHSPERVPWKSEGARTTDRRRVVTCGGPTSARGITDDQRT